ncbi:hypothetical protein GCM10010252_12210 [Streptomyces aureoverticillatus]|nr:hypothetical protein GCM10010252_12210 [Streptomyces aureoverticillatus]
MASSVVPGDCGDADEGDCGGPDDDGCGDPDDDGCVGAYEDDGGCVGAYEKALGSAVVVTSPGCRTPHPLARCAYYQDKDTLVPP